MIEPGVIVTPIFTKAMENPRNPESPYIGGQRLGELFGNALMGAPGTPDMVAEVIWHAITADAPELRYLVGSDAERIAGRRLEMSDEEWIARQSDPDDDQYRKWISEVSGVQVNALPG